MEQIDLVKVCHMLVDEFSTSELLSICSELGIDGGRLGLKDDPPRIETIVALVAHLNKRLRVPALLMACNQRRSGVVSDMLLRRPSVEWMPKKVPQHIVNMVSDLLGVKGEKYSYFENQQQVETGCVYWHIEVDEWDDFAPIPIINGVLERVREVLANETVIAYKGDLVWGWGDRLSSRRIVVAATDDQFDILRIERTEAVNAHLNTVELIYELQKINRNYGIDILGASGGAVEFTLKRTPQGPEVQEFRQWLLWLDLGPNVLPRGQELPNEFLTGPIGLWWD